MLTVFQEIFIGQTRTPSITPRFARLTVTLTRVLTIFVKESCPNFESSLDISVAGDAQVNSQFGYYLQATVVPPAIQQAYVYMNASVIPNAEAGDL
jgi:hypothetical protein